MTLSAALRTATSSLAGNAQQVSALSRNIAGVGDPNYVRRDAKVQTALYGTVRVETQRHVNQSIFSASILANANTAKTEAIASALSRLSTFNGEANFAGSPAALIDDLALAADFAASAPADAAALTALVEQGRSVAMALNSMAGELYAMQAAADKEISHSVGKLNDMLAQLEQVNTQIVNGTRMGADVFDSMDMRDTLLNDISKEIGISVVQREHNDVIVMASNGLLLFEGKPRSVSFQQTPAFGPNTGGAQLFIDGAPVSGASASLPIHSGKIAGNLELRDGLLPTQLRQLDEIARGLVEAFAETDQSGGGKPALAGLFTWSGGPAIPASGVLEPGIAASISVNPLVDGAAGGDPALIRDGAINGDADYIYNSGGGAGFSDRLTALGEALKADRSFAADTGLPTSQGLGEYAAGSLNWLNARHRSEADLLVYRSELSVRFKETLQNETGPNLDYEMSRLLEVERAYQATAKLIAAVDEMLQTLLNSV